MPQALDLIARLGYYLFIEHIARRRARRIEDHMDIVSFPVGTFIVQGVEVVLGFGFIGIIAFARFSSSVC